MIVAVYDTLRARGNLWGTYVRPSGADSYPPPAGTRVLWVLCQPIQDLVDQGKALGWTNKGTIGNGAHLQKHGDHTGHSAGKLGGVVYAKDTWCDRASVNALLELCRRPDYDTSWIDFFNALGGQYSYAGKRVRSSDDQHLHISVKRGQETRRVTLFTDMAAVMAGTFGKPVPTPSTPIAPTAQEVNTMRLVKQKGKPEVYLTDGKTRKHVTGPSTSAMYLSLVAAWGKPVEVETLDAFGPVEK